jgi:hypothetical protein
MGDAELRQRPADLGELRLSTLRLSLGVMK